MSAELLHGALLHGGGAASVTTVAVVARDVLLSANALVAGPALLRPRIGTRTSAGRIVAVVAAAVAAVGDLNAVGVGPWLAALLGLATLVLAVAPLRPAAECVGGLLLTALLVAEAVFGLVGVRLLAGVVHSIAAVLLLGVATGLVTAPAGQRRALLRGLGPVAIAALVTVAGSGLALAVLAGLGPDQRLLRTMFGALVLAQAGLTAVAVGLGLLPAHRSARIAATTALVLATGAGASLAGVPLPGPGPEPGKPLLATVALGPVSVPVLLVPQRPGWNLVHVTADPAAPILVDADGAAPVPATARPGAAGDWALVDLPAGWGRLVLRSAGRWGSVLFNTGSGSVGGSVGESLFAGPDGPECAEAALGQLAAGGDGVLTGCPSDALAPDDARLLIRTVRFLAMRRWHGVTLVGDDSARSTAAERVVRAACAASGIAVANPANPAGPVLLVSGWPTAQRTLTAIERGSLPGEGAYLARWLVSAPLLSLPAGQLVALRYAPGDPQPLRYLAELRAIFPGEQATADGYAAWQHKSGITDSGDPVLYAGSWLTWSPQDFQHAADDLTWLPHGAIIPATGPLPEG